MPIFDMYGGRPNLFTENEIDRMENPEKYNYNQARYDAFIAGLEAKVASRQAVDKRGSEAVLTSYANFGIGGTNPGFSLAGRSGHTSGGLAGNALPAQYAEGGRVEQESLGEDIARRSRYDAFIAGLSPQEKVEFDASLLGMDAEFQMEVAPYMPKGSEIDPSKARLKIFPEEADVGPLGLTLKGVSTKGVKDVRPFILENTFNGYELELEPDTVSAIEPVNANPALWAHEYRHFESSDGGSEVANRLQDLMASQNAADLAYNARWVIGELYARSKSLGNSEDKEKYRGMYNSAVGNTEEETVELVQELLEDRTVTNTLRRGADAFENAAKSPYFNRITGADESIMDTLRGYIDTLRGYLPDGYAEGGMVQNVQHMQLGGLASPYADPASKPQMMSPQAPQMTMGGVGGLFQDMNQNQLGTVY
jgi:hypothetical protein